MDSRVEEVLRISADCYERFRPYRNLCQDIAENFYPLRADFTRSLNMEEFAGNLMDGFTTNTRETLANAIDAMLRQVMETYQEAIEHYGARQTHARR